MKKVKRVDEAVVAAIVLGVVIAFAVLIVIPACIIVAALLLRQSYRDGNLRLATVSLGKQNKNSSNSMMESPAYLSLP